MIDPFETFYLSITHDGLVSNEVLADSWKSVTEHLKLLNACPIPSCDDGLDVSHDHRHQSDPIDCGDDECQNDDGHSQNKNDGRFWAVNARIVSEFNKSKFRLTGLTVNICPFIDHKRQRVLLVCDLDSTLIRGETIDEMARLCCLPDVKAKVEELTRASMAGDLDFAEALRQRCLLLAGLDADVSFLTLPQLNFGN